MTSLKSISYKFFVEGLILLYKHGKNIDWIKDFPKKNYVDENVL